MLDYIMLMMTDGRDDLLGRSLPSMLKGLSPKPTRVVIHDDSGDQRHRTSLMTQFPNATVIGAGPRRGFGGAIRYAWDWIKRYTTAPWIFHTEDDFTLCRPLHVPDLAHAMDYDRGLLQMALLRGPENPAEHLAGGIIQQHPEAYRERRCSAGCCGWRRHDLFWTTNPSLLRREIVERLEWPEGAHSEGHFTRVALDYGWDQGSLARPGFAFWGPDGEEPRVEHIGTNRRSGTGY